MASMASMVFAQQTVRTGSLVLLAVFFGGCASEPTTPANRAMLNAGSSTNGAVSPTVPGKKTAIADVVGKLPAMARPVVVWIHAVKNRDAERIAEVFSSKIRTQFGGKSWPEVLTHYDRLWREKFGTWQPSDFRFHGTSYLQGQGNRGLVLVSFEPPGTRPKTTQVRVVREGRTWFVDQK